MVQYVFALSLVVSAFIVIKAVVDFMNQMGQLRTKEVRIDHELDTRKSEIPDKRKLVEVLRQAATPRKRLHQKMRTYHEGLKETELAAERKKWGRRRLRFSRPGPNGRGKARKR